MTEDKRPDVSLAIASFNTRDLLRDCLQSVYETTHGDLDIEVVVTDNHSTDGSAEMVEREFPSAILIRNDHNVGFGRATNQALAAATGRFLLLLNPDTRVRPRAIRLMKEFLERNPDVGVVGPKVWYPTGRIQRTARTFPNLLTGIFNSKSILTRLFPDNPWSRAYTATDADYERTRDVDWLCGACLMTPRKVYEEVGGFDERYFLYSEDVDWCMDIKKKGYRRVYYHEPEILHYEEQTKKTIPVFCIRHRHLSMWKYYRKHYPRGLHRVPLHAAVLTGICCRATVSILTTLVAMKFSRDAGTPGTVSKRPSKG